jgi:hypothetical protein
LRESRWQTSPAAKEALWPTHQIVIKDRARTLSPYSSHQRQLKNMPCLIALESSSNSFNDLCGAGLRRRRLIFCGNCRSCLFTNHNRSELWYRWICTNASHFCDGRRSRIPGVAACFSGGKGFHVELSSSLADYFTQDFNAAGTMSSSNTM